MFLILCLYSTPLLSSRNLIKPVVVPHNVINVNISDTQEISVTILLGTSNAAKTIFSRNAQKTKTAQSNAPSVPVGGDHTANYKGCPAFNSFSKRLKNHQNNKRTQTLKINKSVKLSLPNTFTTSQSKPFYASVISKFDNINATKNNIRLNFFNDLSILSNFLSELSSLINPLLTSVLYINLIHHKYYCV